MIGDWLDPARMSKESQKILQQEGLIFDVTQLVAEAMQEQGITKAQLADRLGKSRSFVTQLLDGNANMTLKTVADVFTAMELELNVGYQRFSWAKAPRADAVPLPANASSPRPVTKSSQERRAAQLSSHRPPSRRPSPTKKNAAVKPRKKVRT